MGLRIKVSISSGRIFLAIIYRAISQHIAKRLRESVLNIFFKKRLTTSAIVSGKGMQFHFDMWFNCAAKKESLHIVSTLLCWYNVVKWCKVLDRVLVLLIKYRQALSFYV